MDSNISVTMAAHARAYDNGQDALMNNMHLNENTSMVGNWTTIVPAGGAAQNPPRICSVYDFLMEAVLMGILCLFGFAGNTLSMICLWRDKSKTATPFLLVSLELADTLFLITVLILRVLTSIHQFTDSLSAVEYMFPYFAKYVYPCALVTETGTIYLTILVTVNRYISVCRPYEASDLCSVHHARKHVVLVSLFSIVYNIPRFFEYVLSNEYVEYQNKTVLRAIHSYLGAHKVYQIVYGIVLYYLVMFLVPLISLIILNYKLIKALRKTKRKRAQLLSTTDSQSRSEDDITLVLIVVVLVFVVCQTPALITQLLHVLLPKPQTYCPNPTFYFERVSDLLVVANSSINFGIYCFCSRKFRQILLSLMCKLKMDSPEPSHASKAYKTVYNENNTTVKTMCAASAVAHGSKDSQV